MHRRKGRSLVIGIFAAFAAAFFSAPLSAWAQGINDDLSASLIADALLLPNAQVVVADDVASNFVDSPLSNEAVKPPLLGQNENQISYLKTKLLLTVLKKNSAISADLVDPYFYVIPPVPGVFVEQGDPPDSRAEILFKRDNSRYLLFLVAPSKTFSTAPLAGDYLSDLTARGVLTPKNSFEIYQDDLRPAAGFKVALTPEPASDELPAAFITDLQSIIPAKSDPAKLRALQTSATTSLAQSVISNLLDPPAVQGSSAEKTATSSPESPGKDIDLSNPPHYTYRRFSTVQSFASKPPPFPPSGK